MRLLVVEDDPHLGDGLCTGLRQQGFVVDWVQNGLDASAALDTETYAAVVLDIALPGRNGLEVLRQARARKNGSRTETHIAQRCVQPGRHVRPGSNGDQGGRRVDARRFG